MLEVESAWTGRVVTFVMLGTGIPAVTRLYSQPPLKRLGLVLDWRAFTESRTSDGFAGRIFPTNYGPPCGPETIISLNPGARFMLPRGSLPTLSVHWSSAFLDFNGAYRAQDLQLSSG